MTPVEARALASGRLVALIREQAAAEVADVLARARERAASIAADTAARVAEIEAAARREGERRGRRQAARLLAAADAESRRQRLWDREALVDEVLRGARAELALESADASVLAALVREGLEWFPPGRVRVRVVPGSLTVLQEAGRAALLQERWQLDVESDERVGPGAVLESEDGRLRYDNSFDARLRRHLGHLRKLVVGLLLGEEAAVL